MWIDCDYLFHIMNSIPKTNKNFSRDGENDRKRVMNDRESSLESKVYSSHKQSEDDKCVAFNIEEGNEQKDSSVENNISSFPEKQYEHSVLGEGDMKQKDKM